MKKKSINAKPLLFVLVLIMIVFGSLFVFKDYFAKEENSELIDKEDIITKKTVSFTFAGSVLINSEMWYDALSNDGYDFDYMFSSLQESFVKSDINAYFEQSIVGGIDLKKSVNSTYNTPKEILDSVNKLGFNHVSFASSHVYDKGEAGINNSINYLDEMKLSYSGISNDSTKNNNIIDVDGIKVGIVSYTTKTNAKLNDSTTVKIYSEELAKKEVESLNTDIIVVMIDWSNYQSTSINEAQEEIATYLSTLGVDIVIGNNESVVEPIKMVNNTLVCYSIGNLMTGHSQVDSKISSIVDLKLTITNTNGKTEKSFDEVNVLFTYGYNKSESNYKVIPFSSITNELKDYKVYYDKYSAIIKGTDIVNVYTIGD